MNNKNNYRPIEISKLREILKEELNNINTGFYNNRTFSLEDYRKVVREQKIKIPKLYRYIRPDYYILRNIETNKLKLTISSNLNDSFESMPVFTEDIMLDIKKRKKGSVENIANTNYIKSFTTLNNDSLMWSYYTDGGRGLMLEYDLSRLNSSCIWTLNHLFPVVYADERLLGLKIYEVISDLNLLNADILLRDNVFNENEYPDLQKFKDLLTFLTLVKSSIWKHENEWRLSLPILDLVQKREDVENESIEIANEFNQGIIEFDCLSAVYCGPRIEKDIGNHVEEIIRRKNKNGRIIKLFYMGVDPEKFELIAMYK